MADMSWEMPSKLVHAYHGFIQEEKDEKENAVWTYRSTRV